MRALLPGNVRSFSGKAKQTQAPLSTLEAPLKHLEANQANQAVNVTVTVNGTGIVNVIDYSLLVQSTLPGCGRSAQGAPFAQLALRRAGDLTHARRPQKARTAASTGCCMPSGSGRICAGWSFLRAVAAKNRRAAAKYARKMRTLAKDFHRCCKNRVDAGEEKSRYSVFISRLRPGKRFSGIYTRPERNPALKRENFA